MYFIASCLTILFIILGLIFNRVLNEIWLPAFWQSRYGKRFKRRISQLIRNLFFDIRNNIIAHLMTLCEPDGDEPFEPYMDSPLRTCPPCEFLDSPPKESVLAEPNNNNFRQPIARRGRGRGVRGHAHQVIRLPVALPQINLREWAGLEVPPQSPPPVIGARRDALRMQVLINEHEALRHELNQLGRMVAEEANAEGQGNLNRQIR